MEEIDLITLLKMFWARKIAIIIIIAVSICAGLIYTLNFVTPVYTSSTKILLATANKSDSATAIDESITKTELTLNSSTYSELIKSKNILRKVIENLNLNISENDLKRMISVSSVKDTTLMVINVTNKDNELARDITNEIANVFIDMIKEYYQIENIYIVDKAEIEGKPSNINHKKDILIATAIGMLISIAYVLLRSMLDTTVKTEEEIEKLFDLPVLATIPVYEVNLKKTKRGRSK